MPSAERALEPAARHRAQAVGEDRDHQRRDHQGQDQRRREQAVAAERDDVGDRRALLSVITWLPMNGTITSTPSRPKITDGTLASRRMTGSQDAAHPLGRELDDEDRDEQRPSTKLSDHRAAGDQDRAPDHRPGVERVDGVGAAPGPEVKIRICWSTLPPRPEPAEAVVRERRPRLGRRRRRPSPAAARRSRQTSAPSKSSARWSSTVSGPRRRAASSGRGTAPPQRVGGHRGSFRRGSAVAGLLEPLVERRDAAGLLDHLAGLPCSSGPSRST